MRTTSLGTRTTGAVPVPVDVWDALTRGDLWGIRPDGRALARLNGGAVAVVRLDPVPNGGTTATVERLYDYELWQPEDFLGWSFRATAV